MQLRPWIYWHWYKCFVQARILDLVSMDELKMGFPPGMVGVRWQDAREYLIQVVGQGEGRIDHLSTLDPEGTCRAGDTWIRYSRPGRDMACR